MKTLVSIFLIMTTIVVSAQNNPTQAGLKALISKNQDHITSMANAFTQEQYQWRPAEGVRSVGETILHIAVANYFFASKLGFEMPKDVDLTTMEKLTEKEKVVETLTKSFVFVLDKIAEVNPADYDKEIDLGFSKLSTLATMMIILEHTGEHKGQLIAYARSIGVTPPWSN